MEEIMRIMIMSDLHFEFQGDGGKKFFNEIKPAGTDLLVVAGDVGLKQDLKKALKELCSRFPNVIFVFGNHEFYNSSFEKIRRYVDRRKHKRFKVTEGMLAVPVSAKSVHGRVMDISAGGLSFQYHKIEDLTLELSELAIIMADEKCLINHIPCKTISDIRVRDVSDNVEHEKTNRHSVQFTGLTPDQTDQLSHLIQNYTLPLKA